MKLRLYLIKALYYIRHDEYDGFVVAANSDVAAIDLMKVEHPDEIEDLLQGYTVSLISNETTYTKPTIVLGSYRAG